MPGDPAQAGGPGPTGQLTEPAAASQVADERQTGERGRAAEILKKPGATPSRLLVLDAFRRWREEQGGNPGSPN